MRSYIRNVMMLLALFGVLAIPAVQFATSRAQAQDGGIEAASTVLSQWGTIGLYRLPEPPDNDPVDCHYHYVDGQQVVEIQPDGPIYVTARTGSFADIVDARYILYQRLADGTLDYLFAGPSNAALVGPSFEPIVVNGPGVWPGPDYVLVMEIKWVGNMDGGLKGKVNIAYNNYLPTLDGGPAQNLTTATCSSLWPEAVETSATTGTVNSKLNYTIMRYPRELAVPITWDGVVIGEAHTDATARATGSFKIPAAPLGPHTIQWKYGHWDAKITFTVKPRIKVIPNTVSRGQTVNVSLRGFAKKEVVRIRWKKGSSWVELARVTTSNTGSANIDVKVPTWVPNGSTSVRGDGSYGRAQTNAVTVSGGPLTSSTVKTPTPTATATKTPTATATSTPVPNVTESPEATPTPPIEATPDATESATPIAETPSSEVTETPVAETPVSTETATPEPTATEPAEPTATPSEIPSEP
jgi:hypothetical protein